jgi:hypothetical protein
MATKKQPIRTMRLRFVGLADFRKGDRGILDDLTKKNPALKKLREGDVIMVRSGNGDQVLFIHPTREIEGRRGEANSVLASERLRLTWGTWSETMIANYALMVGIRLAGIPTLEQLVERISKSWARALGIKP